MVKSYFVHNTEVALHVLEKGEASVFAPSLLVINGLWEPAERAIPLLSNLPGHVVTFSFRGRGLSSTPEQGYDLAGHLGDIEAVVKHCGLDNYCVLGFSRGAAYALGWSLRNQQHMQGLLLVDQPPVHSSHSEKTVKFWSELNYSGVPILNFMRRTALEGLADEAQEIDFAPQLSQLQIPVTLFVGRNREAVIPSDISEDDLEKYKRSICSLRIIEFLESGHMIPDEEQGKYIREVRKWMGAFSDQQMTVKL
ncbi:alpha/beta fold hydrolase [Paenibacillus pedocola]|uniref:alpha/beta fold hydrolase n=1 Tax=Paenibacillus pedocola TaxID=3242193 RepID=UPI00287746EC|nr:alpha/beta hydrolase [Paenibacillus typhae]